MEQKTILIVDDEEEIIENIIFDLRKFNLQILSARNGGEAFANLEENEIDCIVTDINMPLINGIKFAEKLQKDGYEIPLIFLTAHGDKYLLEKESKNLNIMLNAYDIVNKPYDLNEFVKIIASAVGVSISDLTS